MEEREEREEVVDLLLPPLLFTLLIEVLVARLEDSAMPLARLNKAGKGGGGGEGGEENIRT